MTLAHIFVLQIYVLLAPIAGIIGAALGRNRFALSMALLCVTYAMAIYVSKDLAVLGPAPTRIAQKEGLEK